MDKKEFLSLLSFSAASITIGSCLSGCVKNAGVAAAPSNVDFTLDLSQAANAALLTNGGYLYKNSVIVARTAAGVYIAVQQICTHESVSVVYQSANHRFYCNGHGATFSENGVVTGGPAPAALQVYNTSLTDNMLRVYS